MNLWSHRFSQNLNKKSSWFDVVCRAEILIIFRSYFGRNNDFINSFWNLLTFLSRAFDLDSCNFFCGFSNYGPSLRGTAELCHCWILIEFQALRKIFCSFLKWSCVWSAIEVPVNSIGAARFDRRQLFPTLEWSRIEAGAAHPQPSVVSSKPINPYGFRCR